MPASCRTTASTRATWKGTLSPLPASAPVMASGGCSGPGRRGSACQGPSTRLTLQGSELRLRIEGPGPGPDSGTPLCTWASGLCLRRQVPHLQGSPWAWTLSACMSQGRRGASCPSGFCPSLGSMPGAGTDGSLLLPSAHRGFFQAGSAVHLIEPLGDGGEEGRHALYRAQHLRQKAGTCGVSNTSLESMLGPRTLAAFRPRVSRPRPASSLPSWACAPPRLPGLHVPQTPTTRPANEGTARHPDGQGACLPGSRGDGSIVRAGTS